MKQVYVAGTGSYLPGNPIPFDRINEVLGELDQAPAKIRKWMRSTHGVMKELLDIEFVHYAIDPRTRDFTDDNISMAVKAAEKALAAAGLAPGDIDLICYGSAHQDQMPTASVRIQEQLGIAACAEISIHANCTSAYKALHIANHLIQSGQNTTALVLSASMSSSELRAEYYNQQLVSKESLFLRWFLCDGAGALIITADPEKSAGCIIETTYIESIGGNKPSLMFNHRPAYWMNPKEEYDQGRHHLCQTFRNALAAGEFQEDDGSVFLHGFQRMVARGSIPVGSIRFFQINLPTHHIVESVMAECAGLGITADRFYSKLNQLGYCGPPMMMICLDRILREETLRPDDRIVSFVTEVSKFMQAGYALRYVG